MDLNVAFIIFNRPDTTRIVFEQIRLARPDRLFVIADGPRLNKTGEAQRCAEARQIVDNGVDWDCQVLKNYAESNLGCRFRPPSGISWVFEHVDHCIILEDDCVPHPSFFPFCQELLEKYQNDTRIMSISGDNFQKGEGRTPYSYYFSDIVHIWGWATWKRAWDKYDGEMSLWPELKRGGWLHDIFPDARVVRYWTDICNNVHNGSNTWDMQWLLSCWLNRGLCILPKANLVSNIGFDKNATHSTKGSFLSKLPTVEMKMPLLHPPNMIRDARADIATFEFCYKEHAPKLILRKAIKTAHLDTFVRRIRR